MPLTENNLITLHVFAEDYPRIKSWQLMQWCKAHGADEWSVSAISVEGSDSGLFDRFDEAVALFRLPDAPRRHLTAYSDAQFTRAAWLWELTPASFSALQEFLPSGLFSYASKDEGWFEDPMIYREGELMLGIVSHESEGILRVTRDERQLLERDGFPFRASGAYVGY